MILVGIDEVGRGCWAGPVVSGAVILPGALPGVRDSKLLSQRQREILAATIEIEAVAWAIGWASSQEVDELGLSGAVRLSMERALAGIEADYDEVVIDGNVNFLAALPHTHTLIKADQLVPAVSAASILAKVARDSFMRQQALLHPGYGFERHVGYGTTAHRQALSRLGICELHRRSVAPIRELAAGGKPRG